MSAPQSNFDAEREIDLARRRAALRRLWWFAAKAVAQKSTARSRRTSLIIGALIGLLLGAIVAVVADGRTKRAVPVS